MVGRWRINLRSGLHGDKRKTFSVQTNGLIPAFYMACQYRELLVKMENENGSKFTERNGK